MRCTVPILISLVFFMSSSQGCSQPEPHPEDEPTRQSVSSEWFDSVRWQNRLLVFGGEGDDIERQKTLVIESRDGYLERDLLVIHLSDDNATLIVQVLCDSKTT